MINQLAPVRRTLPSGEIANRLANATVLEGVIA
jgi:hypothetical protein